uniref:Proton-activated chloride channel n=1 Tax=Eptatretus burgeri TaxID=7764 RepID=A0A8C4QBE7_EPTBU
MTEESGGLHTCEWQLDNEEQVHIRGELFEEDSEHLLVTNCDHFSNNGGTGPTSDELLDAPQNAAHYWKSTLAKVWLKNVASCGLVIVFLLLAAVAAFVAYQSISDFQRQAKHPAMSVSFKEVKSFEAPGIVLFPERAELLSCKHFYGTLPPLDHPGEPGPLACVIQEVYSEANMHDNVPWKRALVIRGPEAVLQHELLFLHFRLNQSQQDFSGINYLLFSSFDDFTHSNNGSAYLEKLMTSRTLWSFSGGFCTWVKLSLIRTPADDSRLDEFHQETNQEKYNQRREADQLTELFFVVFEWKDPFIQEVHHVVTASPWNVAAVLCGVFLALFKVADFAKISVKWMLKVRRRHRRHRARQLNSMPR